MESQQLKDHSKKGCGRYNDNLQVLRHSTENNTNKFYTKLSSFQMMLSNFRTDVSQIGLSHSPINSRGCNNAKLSNKSGAE